MKGKPLTKREFLQRAVCGFREQKPHKDNFVCKPGNIYDEPFPRNVAETDGVDKSGEEASETTKKLEDSNTPGALHVRPDFDHVC